MNRLLWAGPGRYCIFPGFIEAGLTQSVAIESVTLVCVCCPFFYARKRIEPSAQSSNVSFSSPLPNKSGHHYKARRPLVGFPSSYFR